MNQFTWCIHLYNLYIYIYNPIHVYTPYFSQDLVLSEYLVHTESKLSFSLCVKSCAHGFVQECDKQMFLNHKLKCKMKKLSVLCTDCFIFLCSHTSTRVFPSLHLPSTKLSRPLPPSSSLPTVTALHSAHSAGLFTDCCCHCC